MTGLTLPAGMKQPASQSTSGSRQRPGGTGMPLIGQIAKTTQGPMRLISFSFDMTQAVARRRFPLRPGLHCSIYLGPYFIAFIAFIAIRPSSIMAAVLTGWLPPTRENWALTLAVFQISYPLVRNVQRPAPMQAQDRLTLGLRFPFCRSPSHGTAWERRP
jgi:hypothetical protein